MFKVIHMCFFMIIGFILSSCENNNLGGSAVKSKLLIRDSVMTVNMPILANATNVSRIPNIVLNTSLPVAAPRIGAIVLKTIAGISVPITRPIVLPNSSGGSIITFFAASGASPLQSNTIYQVIVNSSLLSTSGVAATPISFQFATGNDSSFIVNVTSPVNGETIKTLLPSISLVSNSGFLSAANVAANVELTKGSTVVTLPIPVLSNNNTIATFTLTTPLQSCSSFTITLTGGANGIQSASGDTITGNVSSSFNTGLMTMAGGMACEMLVMSYTTGGLNMDMVSSGDGVNWNVNMLATSFQQFIVSGSNILLLGSRGAMATSSASPFSSYQIQKFPTVNTQSMNQYASNGIGTVVGVGGVLGAGTIVYSLNNGVTWNQLTLGANPLTQVAFGNGIFVALDTAGNAYNSTNGISWSALTATGLGMKATAPILSFANGLFVVVTNAATGLNFSSFDGITWTAGVSIGAGASSLAFGTISGVNYWVVGETTGAIAYQVVATNAAPIDGWIQVASIVGANGIRTMTFGNNLFVGGALNTGQIIYSSGSGGAPSAFTLVGSIPLGATSVNSIGFGGANDTTFVAVGANGNIAVSTADIATWQPAVITMPISLEGQSLANGVYSSINGVLYLGNNTFITGGNNSVVLRSMDGGITWHYPTNPPSIPGNAIALGHLTIGGVGTPMQIMVGNAGSIYYSTTKGSTWTLAKSGTTQNLNAVVCGDMNYNGMCVAVGANGTIIYTTNGSTWTTAISSTFKHLKTITFGNGMFVAAGNAGVIASSLNGITWITDNVENQNYNAIAYGEIGGSIPVFVAAGASGQLSYNITSSSRSIGKFVSNTFSANGYNAIAFGTVNSISAFVAVGAAGQASRSLDGVNWVQGGAGARANTAVTNSSSLWVVSATTGGAATSIYTSSDGVNYTAVTLPLAATVNAVSYFANLNTFIAVTASNGVLSSGTPSLTSSWSNYLTLQGLLLSKIN